MKAERGPLYQTLLAREQELQTLQALATPTASLVRAAEDATKVQPRRPEEHRTGNRARPASRARDSVHLGGTRQPRSLGRGVVELLGMPLLGRIREVPRAIASRLAMLETPSSSYAEGYRILGSRWRRSIDASVREAS